jgi:hypothetical protein
MYRDVTRAQVTAVSMSVSPERRVRGSEQSYPRSDSFPVGLNPYEPDLHPVIARANLVQQKASGAVIVGHDYIDVPIVVVVEKSQPRTHVS